MRVLGITWAGVRSADLVSARGFFADVLGLRPVGDGGGVILFEMPTGQLFEVFGPESRGHGRLSTGPVLGFQVEDVRTARNELLGRGVEFVTGIEGGESEAWTYFRGPDGVLYELWQTERPMRGVSSGSGGAA